MFLGDIFKKELPQNESLGGMTKGIKHALPAPVLPEEATDEATSAGVRMQRALGREKEKREASERYAQQNFPVGKQPAPGSSKDNKPETEAELHTKYKRNRFKSLEQRRRKEEELLSKAMHGIRDVDESEGMRFNDDDFYAFDPETKEVQSSWTHKDVGRRHSEHVAHQNGWQIVSGMRARSLGLLPKSTITSAKGKDWDEGHREPGNNFAVYINGKKWKVFPGDGSYGGSKEEGMRLRQLKDWAAKKSASSGKRWEVYITGEPATPGSVKEGDAGTEFTGYWKGTDKRTPGKHMVGGTSESVEESQDDLLQAVAESMERSGYEFTEEKTRLDPSCWHNKKIGKPKTKMKGGVRVNNCVPK